MRLVRGRRSRQLDDSSGDLVDLLGRAESFTLTGAERMLALRDVTRYVVEDGVPGSFVDCGVGPAESMQVVALTLLECGCRDRDLYLYDAVGRPSGPDDDELDLPGRAIQGLIETGYPPERIHWTDGGVGDAGTELAAAQIALLRLDTAYVESTGHELGQLEPRVSDGGVVLVDDFGHDEVARSTTDQHCGGDAAPGLLRRIDYSARIVVVKR